MLTLKSHPYSFTFYIDIRERISLPFLQRNYVDNFGMLPVMKQHGMQYPYIT